MNPLALIALGVGVFYLGKRNVQNVYWRISAFRIHKVNSLSDTTVIVQVEFNNASLLTYRIERPYFVLMYEGEQLATLSYTGLIEIKPQSTTKIDVPIRLMNGPFLGLINQGINEPENPLNCQVSGTVFLGAIPLLKGQKIVSLRPLFDKYANQFKTLASLAKQLNIIKPKK